LVDLLTEEEAKIKIAKLNKKCRENKGRNQLPRDKEAV